MFLFICLFIYFFQILTFNRSNVFEEILKEIGKYGDIFDDNTLIRFQNPDGSYELGVGEGTKHELVALFLERLYEKLCFGDTFLLFKTDETDESMMKSVTNVIGIIYKKYFVIPIKICQTLWQFALFENLDNDLLVEDFLSIIPRIDRDMFKRGEEEMAKGNFAVCFYFEKYLSNWTRKKIMVELRDNYQELLRHTAEEYVLKQNHDWILTLREGLKFVRENLTPVEVMLMYLEITPTGPNIIKKLICAKPGSRIYQNLCQFLMDNEEHGESFLFEITSSTILFGKEIIVDFYKDEENSGKICIGTCGNQVTFPEQFEDLGKDDLYLVFKAFCSGKKKFTSS